MARSDSEASPQEDCRPVPTTKQLYRRPELLQYGSLREITLMLARGERHDGVSNCGEFHNEVCHTN
jgi:hypothetical protein